MQYVDVKSRLEAKRAARMRYLDFLKQTKNVEEILLVQSEIDEMQEAMESAAGRINSLSSASDVSSIHLTYFKVLNVSAKESDDPGFFQRNPKCF